MRVFVDCKKNLLFFLLIILTLSVNAKNSQNVSSAQAAESFQNLIIPVISQVIQQVNDRIQNQKPKNNKRDNKPKKDEIHFIYNQDILPSNYFIKDRKLFINLHVLKNDENFEQNCQSSVDVLNETLKKAGNAKKEDLIDYIIINSDTPFYTYYQYLQPGLLNVLRQDNLYKNEIEKFDNLYLKYTNIITNLILNSSLDLIVYKNDDVVYEHDVIQANDGHMIDSYMVSNDDEMQDINNSLNVPTKATASDVTYVPVELRIKHYIYFAPKMDSEVDDTDTTNAIVSIKTPDGVSGTLFVDPIPISLIDAVNVKTDTGDSMDVNIIGPVVDILGTDYLNVKGVA